MCSCRIQPSLPPQRKRKEGTAVLFAGETSAIWPQKIPCSVRISQCQYGVQFYRCDLRGMKRRCRKPKHTKEQNVYSWNDSTGSFLSTIEKIVNLKFYKHSVHLLRADLDPRTEVSPSVDQKRHLNYAPVAPRLRGRIRLTLFFGLQQLFNF